MTPVSQRWSRISDRHHLTRIIPFIATIRKAAELGFLRALKGQADHWEVRRILKAYVDAETLSDFAGRLREYAGKGLANE